MKGMKNCRLFFLLLFTIAFNVLYAQLEKRVDLDFIDFKEGLNSRFVIGMVKDAKGFTWITTYYAGIYRYDGYEFKDLYDLLPNTLPLKGKIISSTIKTKKGELLIFYSGSNMSNIMDVFDPTSGKVTSHKIINTRDGNFISINYINKLRSGDIILYSTNSSGKVSAFKLTEDKEFDPIYTSDVNEIASSPKSNSPIIIANSLESDGVIWQFTDQQQISRYWSQTSSVQNIPIIPHLKNTTQNQFSYILEDSQKRIWLGSQHRSTRGQIIRGNINYYSESKNQFVSDSLLEGFQFIQMFFEVDTDLYIFSEEKDGFTYTYLYNFKEKWIEKLDRLLIRPISLNKSNIIKESKGTYLLTTSSGIVRLQIKKKSLQQYLAKDINNYQFGISTRGIAGDKNGNIYFATEEHGWYHLNSNKHESLQEIDFNGCISKHSLPRQIFLDNNGVLWGSGSTWLGTTNLKIYGLLVSWDPSNQQSRCFPYPSYFNAIAPSSNGILLSPQSEGTILRFSPQTEKFDTIISSDKSNLFNKAIVCEIVERKDGNLWISSNLGLFFANLGKQTIQLVTTGSDRKQSLTQEPLFDLFEDTDETLWIGTDGAGLKHLNPITNEVKIYDENYGICNNKVVGIVPDDQHHLWVSTFHGLAYFDKKNKNFINFSTEDGLSYNEFNRTSFFKDHEANYYFGGMNGYNVFKKDDLIPTAKKLKTQISSITRWNNQLNQPNIQYNHFSGFNKIVLPADNRYLKLNLMTDDYSNSSNNHFQYFLEGFHDDWQILHNSNEVIFNYLPAGSYLLKIKGSNSFGDWSEEELEIEIKVKEYFFRSIWFFLILFVLICGVIYGFFLYYRLQRVLALQSMRTQISSDLHDEVGSSLTRLSMIMQSVDVDDSPTSAKNHLSKGNEVLMSSISKIRDVVWAIDAKNDQAGELIDRMMDFAYDLLNAKEIDYNFLHEGIPRNLILPPLLRQNIYLIYKEAIQNIVKHSEAKMVNIKFIKQEGIFHLNIQNDIRSQKTLKVKGSGLDNMRLRAHRINGKLQITKESELFIIDLVVPINK